MKDDVKFDAVKFVKFEDWDWIVEILKLPGTFRFWIVAFPFTIKTNFSA